MVLEARTLRMNCFTSSVVSLMSLGCICSVSLTGTHRGVSSWQLPGFCCGLRSHQLVIKVIIGATVVLDVNLCGNGADRQPLT